MGADREVDRCCIGGGVYQAIVNCFLIVGSVIILEVGVQIGCWQVCHSLVMGSNSESRSAAAGGIESHGRLPSNELDVANDSFGPCNKCL